MKNSKYHNRYLYNVKFDSAKEIDPWVFTLKEVSKIVGKRVQPGYFKKATRGESYIPQKSAFRVYRYRVSIK